MDLLAAASELCKLELTKVRVRATGLTATIVPPGSHSGKLVLRIDNSGKCTKLRPKEVELIEIAAPKKPPPMAIGAQCGLCLSNPATSK